MISIIKCQASIKQLQLPTTSGWLPVQEAQALNLLTLSRNPNYKFHEIIREKKNLSTTSQRY